MDKLDKALTGAQAAAEAMRQINPEVVPVYPITPQTPIVETYAGFLANEKVNSEMIHVESEHSAMSATVGAQVAGVRAMTASSSAGLALMFEVLGVASGLRLPILMNVVNRALSSPINIHCDHSDSMGVRDMGWIQFYSEDAQEVYYNNFLALKLAEKVNLPAMVMQDGFITSHCLENVSLLTDKQIREFIGDYKPQYPLLNIEKPVTVGALQLTDYYFETKRQQIEAMEEANNKYEEVAQEFEEISGEEFPKLEVTGSPKATNALVVMSSTAGTAKAFLNKNSEENLKIIKIRLFLPFPEREIKEALAGVEKLAVLDRSVAYGSRAPIYKEIKNVLYSQKNKPQIQSYVFGLGGREIYEKDIARVMEELKKGNLNDEEKYIGLRE